MICSVAWYTFQRIRLKKKISLKSGSAGLICATTHQFRQISSPVLNEGSFQEDVIHVGVYTLDDMTGAGK
jgi:hypothetical protein